MSTDEIGRMVRATRKRLALRQEELAALCGVGTRFLSELENGKESLEIGRVMRVLAVLGLELSVRERSAQHLRMSPGATT